MTGVSSINSACFRQALLQPAYKPAKIDTCHHL